MNPLLCACVLLAATAAAALEDVRSQPVRFSTPVAEVAGTLLRPAHAVPLPCVVLVGGTFSQTRDGGLVDRPAPPRDALKRLAERLAEGGYASLRFDRVGYGESRPKPGWRGAYEQEGDVAAAAIRFVRALTNVSRVVAAGESAGAYMLCLAARNGTQADAYLWLGGFCGEAEEMYEYNFGRLAARVAQQPADLVWVERDARRDLALGRRYREMFDAARAGLAEFEIVDGDLRWKLPLARRQEELRWRPDAMFRHITAPALALAGQKDLNVPPGHAARAARIMREAGNTNVASLLLPGADHSFQLAPEDEATAFRERYTFESFKRPYSPGFYRAVLRWLRAAAPTPYEAGVR